MLKLERKSKSHPIHISLREGGRLLTPAFQQAFLAALGFHLLALIIFQVKTFFIREGAVYSVQVNLDIVSEKEGEVHSHLEGGRTRFRQFDPKPSHPALPPMPRAAAKGDIAYPKEKQRHLTAASTLLQNPDSFPSFPLSPQEGGESPSFIRVSGDLAERKIIKEARHIFLPHQITHSHCLIAFDIKVEDKTGKIIWYQRKKSSLVGKKLYQKGEKILRQLSFEKKKKGFITSGHIEISLPHEQKYFLGIDVN